MDVEGVEGRWVMMWRAEAREFVSLDVDRCVSGVKWMVVNWSRISTASMRSEFSMSLQ